MPWRCFMAEQDNPIQRARPGALWYGDGVDGWDFMLSDEFERDWRGKRDRLLLVRLPDGTEWCLDFASSTALGAGTKRGWEMVGSPPYISVSPSINVVGRYHGWLRDGMLSDDCEGRTFASLPEQA